MGSRLGAEAARRARNEARPCPRLGLARTARRRRTGEAVTMTIQAAGEPASEWHSVGPLNPPRPGDLIVMALPRTAPCPPGFTRGGAVAWRFADGRETGFP